MSESPDHYEILGVDRDASPEQVKAAFRAAVKLTHPDMGGSADEFGEVQLAFEVLGDTEARADYDENLNLIARNRRLDEEARTRSEAPSGNRPGPSAGDNNSSSPRPDRASKPGDPNGTATSGAAPNEDRMSAEGAPGVVRIVELQPSDRRHLVNLVLDDGRVFEVSRRDLPGRPRQGSVLSARSLAGLEFTEDGGLLVRSRLHTDSYTLRESPAEWLLLGPEHVRLTRYRLGSAALAVVAVAVWFAIRWLVGELPPLDALGTSRAVQFASLSAAAAAVAAAAWPIPFTVGHIQQIDSPVLRWPLLAGLVSAAGCASLLAAWQWWLLPAACSALAAGGAWLWDHPTPRRSP